MLRLPFDSTPAKCYTLVAMFTAHDEATETAADTHKKEDADGVLHLLVSNFKNLSSICALPHTPTKIG